MKQITTTKAITLAVQKEMELDPRVIILGEDIINSGGSMGIYRGLPQQFPDRCLDMPICESGFSHFGNGCALAGLRPIIDLAYSDFSIIAADAIINGAAKFRYCTLGKVSVPIVFVMANGGMATYGNVGSGCNHSQCLESLFLNVPGLKVIMPYFPSDSLGLMRSAIRDNDPVVFLYHKGTAGRRESFAAQDVTELQNDDYIIPLNNAARIIQEGGDVTIVALQSMIPVAMKAAEELKKNDVCAEIIDPRVLVPLDSQKIVESVRKTGRLVVVHEAPSRGGFAGEIIKAVAVESAGLLKKPVKVLGSLNTPVASGFAESYMMPQPGDVVKAVEDIL